jgi:sarcosine oxidase
VGAEHIEVVVVGAGVVGLATGWRLARAGHEVSVLEQDVVGHARGSSHGASRIFRLGYDDADYVAMAAASAPLWRELEQETHEPGLLTVTGALVAGPGMRDVQRALAAAGVACDELDEQEARRRHPEVALSGHVLWEPAAGVLAADRCLGALAHAMTASGGRLGVQTRVLTAADDDRGVTLTTPGGSVRARVAVLCCGAWAPALLRPLGVTFEMVATREQIAYVAPFGPGGSRAEGPQVPVFIQWDEPSYYGLPTPTRGWYKLAEHGTGPVVDPTDEGRSLAPDPVVAGRLRAAAGRFLPGFDSEPVAQETCLYDNTPDRHFIVDRHGHLVVGAGTSGHGFKFAPLLGEALACLALGREPPLPRHRFSLSRPALHRGGVALDRPR